MKADKYILKVIAHKEVNKPILKGDYIGNYKCHLNSLNYILKKTTKSILGCIQVFPNDLVVAHFVVKLPNGDILDPTYGRLAAECYSYLIVIEEYTIEGFKPDRELVNLKKYMYNLLPWYLKIISKPGDF